MKPSAAVPFWQTQTTRLTAFYLTIIMAMTIGFSTILYVTSAAQLDRQVLRDFYVDDRGQFTPGIRTQRYISSQVDSGKRELIIRLLVLNIVMLLFGAAISYMLARKTLEPIERNSEAQSQFVSDVSHELRTPLAAIRTTNEVALRKKSLTIKAARETIRSNIDDVERLQRMTTLLLGLLSDNTALVRETVHIHDIVSMAMTTVAPPAVEKNISIDDKTKNETVYVDPTAVGQALVVLLDNAVKYSNPGSTVTLTTTLRRQAIQLNVTDTGVGVPGADREKIFQRFYRGDQARTRHGTDGYGLGLTIAQRIMAAHGGTIELTSSVGEGSTFSLIIPRGKSNK